MANSINLTFSDDFPIIDSDDDEVLLQALDGEQTPSKVGNNGIIIRPILRSISVPL